MVDESSALTNVVGAHREVGLMTVKRLLGLLLAMVTLMAVVSPAEPAFAREPIFKVQFTTNLRQGQITAVRGARWPANATYLLDECNAMYTTDHVAACYTDPPNPPHTYTTLPDGRISTRINYHSGPVGADGGVCAPGSSDCVLVFAPMKANGAVAWRQARICHLTFQTEAVSESSPDWTSC